MVGKILIPEIRSLIEARDFAGLREIFRDWPPADVAEVIVDLPADDRVIIFRVLPAALAADVFEYLDVEAQQELLRCMAHEQVVAILNEMSPDDRTALLEEMPSAAARQLIQLLTPEERRVAQALLGYPEGSVGRLMTPDFVAVRENWTVKEVLDYVRAHGQDSETLNFIYVVDERGKLIDDLRIRNFLLRPLDTRVDEIMDRSYVHLTVNQTQEEALQIFRKYDRAALAVVDSNGALVGIISSGGNSGSQASTLMIRAMALGEVTLRDWWHVMRREIQAGLLLGIILGIIGIMRVAAWAIADERYFHTQPYGEHWPLVALTVGVALVGVVLWGTLSGSMLPFLLRRVGADPATSSAPFVATLVDVTGLVIYFSIALVIMRGAML